MTDEMNKNLENEELDLEQLVGISGGLIVDCGNFHNYRIVDDKTGEILNSEWFLTKNAIIAAEALNVSLEIISMTEYQKRFGKKLDMSIRINSKAGKK